MGGGWPGSINIPLLAEFRFATGFGLVASTNASLLMELGRRRPDRLKKIVQPLCDDALLIEWLEDIAIFMRDFVSF
jgi:hypothetical protein